MNAFEYIFPVTAGSVFNKSEKIMKLRQVLGTCFSIGGGYFLTAAHVISSAIEYEWAGVGYLIEHLWQGAPMQKYEIADDFDIGIIQAETPNCKPLKWSIRSLALLQPVQTIGFPYALDTEHFHIDIRAFSGYIVSERIFYNLKSNPHIYELSFQAPRGLSGAPLIIPEAEMTIGGLVIGNKSTEMQVFSDKEIIQDGQKELIVERYEALQLGIALVDKGILNVYFKILQCTLREHLYKNSLLPTK